MIAALQRPFRVDKDVGDILRVGHLAASPRHDPYI